MKNRGPKTYRDILLTEFQNRKKTNPGYSLNAFAARLGISASHLSRILRGHYGISREMAIKMAELLQLDPTQRDFFTDSAEALHARSSTVRKAAQSKLELDNYFPEPISDAEFSVMGTWVHYAILEFLGIHQEVEEEALKKAFGIPDDRFENILKSVIAMKHATRDGTKIKAAPSSNTPTNYLYPSTAEGRAKLCQLHLDLLNRAGQALNASSDRRHITSGIFSFPSSKKSEAEEMLTDFRREFIAKFGSMNDADGVYALSLSFFRLDD